MRPVSAAFLNAVRGTHPMRAEARIVTGFQTGVDPTGVDIPILGGDVVSDGTADVRSTLDLTTGRDLSSETPVEWPDDVSDLLTPYGHEIFVRRGIEFGDRSTEWVSLGFFRIDSVQQQDAPLGPFAVTGSDRMAGIVDAKLLQPVQFSTGHPVEAVFEQLITEVYPAAVIEFDFDASAVTLGRTVVVEKERYEFLRDLAASYAKDFYVDHRGIFVIRDRPDPGNPVFQVNSGENGVLVSMSRELSRIGAFNAVVATGEGADPVEPVIGIARDMNPDSPTFWDGTFGKVPEFFSAPTLITSAQARDAARKRLQDNLGLPFSLDFTAIPNPALEPFDPVQVRVVDHNYVHTLQRLTIPLTAQQALTATTKDQTSIQMGIT